MRLVFEENDTGNNSVDYIGVEQGGQEQTLETQGTMAGWRKIMNSMDRTKEDLQFSEL